MQQNKQRTRTVWLIIGLILLVGSLVFYYAGKYPFINKKIKEVVSKKTDDLYKISYDSISVDEAVGNLFIYNLSIMGDTSLQKKYIANNDTAAVPLLLHIFVPVLKVVGFKTAGALFNKQMVCNTLIISDPRVTAYIFPGITKNNSIDEEEKLLYKQLLGNFDLIQSDSLSIINAEVAVLDFMSGDIKFHTYNTSLRLRDFRVDSTHYYDTSRTLFSKEVYFHTDRVSVGNEPIITGVTYLTFDTRNKVLGIAEIKHDGIKAGDKFTGTAKGVSIKGLQVNGPIDALKIGISKALFNEVSLEFKKTAKAETDAKNQSKNILNGWIKLFNMDDLQVSALSIKTINPGQKTEPFLLNNSRLKVKNFALDTTSLLNAKLYNNAENVQFSNELISIKSDDGLSMFNFSGLTINSSPGTITLKEFAIKPLLGEEAFAKRKGVQKDRFDVRFKNVKAIGVDIDALSTGKIDIQSVRTSGNTVRIYRDISRPRDSVVKVGNYPHQLLYKIKSPLHIQKFLAANTSIIYKERNPLSKSAGELEFSKSEISIDNITNNPKPAKKMMTMDFNGFLLKEIPLNLKIRFYLQNIAEGQHQVTGSIKKPFSGKSLNPITEPMGLVRIDKGVINELSFNFMADNYNAEGTFLVKYEDLKLSLLKTDDNNKTRKKGLLSFLANIIVKSDNPVNGKLRQADVVYERDIYKSFFNTIWKFVFTGLKDIMGVKF